MRKLNKRNDMVNTVAAYEARTTCGCTGDCNCYCASGTNYSNAKDATYDYDASKNVSKVTYN